MIKMKFTSVRALLFLSVIVFFIFGFNHLTEFVSFDEHYWLYNAESDRIHQYWEALSEGDWEDTRINDKPGITLAWTSGIGMFLEKDQEKQVLFKDGTVKIFDPKKTEEINLYYRLPILLISGLFIFFFFWIIRKITDNEWVALLSAIFIALSPIIIGISQIVNPDSLFWIFSFSSVLSFLALLKLEERKYFWLTLVFFGLSMASKYVSIILIPFYFLMMVSFYLFHFEEWKNKKETLAKIIWKNSLYYVGIILGGFLIFALMMPAVFVEPKYFYEGTIGFPGMAPIFWLLMVLNAAIFSDNYFFGGKITLWLFEKLQPAKKYLPKIVSGILLFTFVFILINWMVRHRLIDLTDVPFDMKRKPGFGRLPFLHQFIMEAVPLVFSVTPIVLFALLYLWSKTIFQKIKYPYLVFILTTFVLIFYLAVIEQGLLLTIRYSIILYPVSAFLAAIAFFEFFSAQKEKSDSKNFLTFFSILSALVLIIFALSSIEQAKIISERELRVFYNFHRIAFFGIFVVLIAAVTQLIYFFLNWKRVRQAGDMMIAGGIIAVSFLNVYLISPYYFSYTNDFMPKKYIITSGWGYGGYEAAAYMNALPNAKETTVWTDSYGFCEFYVGKCIHKTKVRTEKYPVDYIYSTLQSQLRPEFIGKEYRESDEPIWNLEIDGRYKNYVRIFKAEEVKQ